MNFTIQQIEQSSKFREAMGIDPAAKLEFSLLGQGEYNINYLFSHPATGQKLVLRNSTGSQMHLDDQIGYEYHALTLLADSGRTPRPYYLDSENQILVMEYLPGRALDYRTDLPLAAECLAQIHAVKVPQDCHLLSPKEPIAAMFEECTQMVQVFLDSPLGETKTKQQLCRMVEAAQKFEQCSDPMPRCIINTELNSGNFLINGAGKSNYLIDWEKPLIGEAAQDLGHFLAPTTTYWKTDILLDKEQKRQFLYQYAACKGEEASVQQLESRVAEYERMTCLRGVTWCAMAWVEYQNPNRPIQNADTYRKIQDYLSENFLNWLWEHYFV